MELRIALTGFGNVGQGLATLLLRHGDAYRDRYGISILLTAVLDRGGTAIDASGLDPDRLLRAKASSGTVAGLEGGGENPGVHEFLERSNADILVEAASTNFVDAEPGWTYVREAISGRVDVVLASKGSLAMHWDALFALARQHGAAVRYSATIGAPLPTLDIARYSLVGGDISTIEGIVNGTTNQILTAMSRGLSYDEGVRQAQELGIAETDPTLDVDGWDAAAKIAILSNAIFGTSLTVFDVTREGIRDVSPDQLRTAAQDGHCIKLIARATRTSNGVQATVGPEPRDTRDALGRLTGDAMGTVFQVVPLGEIAATVESGGHGGGISTAMTVLRDLLNLGLERSPSR